MKLLRALLGSTRGRMFVLAGFTAAAWQLWLGVEAPGKISPQLRLGSGKVDILVELPFVPERFHVITLQRYGRVSGTQDKAVELRGVNRADLTAVARPYWVTKVEPLSKEGETS